MPGLDLNLLRTMNALIEESSVTRAAERLAISAPSMSRELTRIRKALGDPFLVRAGRQLVPTPRALELQSEVRDLIDKASALLRPQEPVSLAKSERRFIIRANDGFTDVFSARLLAQIATRAPRIAIHFLSDTERADDALREGRIDLEIGGPHIVGPEVRVQTVLRDHYVGLANSDHPIFQACITKERFTSFEQVSVWRVTRKPDPVDHALNGSGLFRRISLTVPSYHSALCALRNSHLIALFPRHVLESGGHVNMSLRSFEPPIRLETTVAQAWHPRLDADVAHRFLRESVRNICIEFTSQMVGRRARANTGHIAAGEMSLRECAL